MFCSTFTLCGLIRCELPRLSVPGGSIRFIVSVPRCASSPRKPWTALPELVRLAAAFRLACGERSALATGESRTGPSLSSNKIGVSASRMRISTWRASMQIRKWARSSAQLHFKASRRCRGA